MSWFAFFLCFFAWFGIAPLMTVVREEMHLSKDQIGWCLIGSVAITVFARLVIGKVVDRYGPRITYSLLLLLTSIPVMGIGLSYNFESFLLFRVLIGAIGASFVLTQYHTTAMFAPNCVGTANATTAGWGNLGGGVTHMAMPLIYALFVSVLGFSTAAGWRLSMVVAGAVCAITGVAYYLLTQDTPEGNYRELRAAGKLKKTAAKGTFMEACRDYRVWALFVVYAACFGVELTMNNIGMMYFIDYFDAFKKMDPVHALEVAGLVAGSFGFLNIFARTLGGWMGDRLGNKWGLSGRVKWLFIVVFLEGLTLMLFSQMGTLMTAIPMMIVFSLFVQMSAGATFAVVPFINPRAMGSVSGIVGAGGNVGAVLGGFLFKSPDLPWTSALLIMGVAVTVCAFTSFAVTFSSATETQARASVEAALEERKRALEPATIA